MLQPRDARFVGERLGQFVEASRWHALPQALRREGKRSLLNFIGCALGVASTPPIEMAMRVLTRLSGAEQVTVIGRAERLDPLGAAFINAVAGNLLDRRGRGDAQGAADEVQQRPLALASQRLRQRMPARRLDELAKPLADEASICRLQHFSPPR